MAGLSRPRPLAREDVREHFNCGRVSLDLWFHRHGWRSQEQGDSRTSVICDEATGDIAGFVSLAMAQIEREYLPRAIDRRNRPSPVPALLLARLAVDGRWQKRGVARELLRFSFVTALRLSREVGCFGVLTHPLDDDVRDFYRTFGFEDLPHDPKRSMIVRMGDLERSFS